MGNYDYTFTIDNYGTMFYHVGWGPTHIHGPVSEKPLSNKCIDTIKAFVQKPFAPHNYYTDVFQFLFPLCDELDAALDAAQTRTDNSSDTAILKLQHCEEMARLISRMEVMEKELARLKVCEEELNRIKQIDADHRRAVAFEQRLLQQQRLETWKNTVNPTNTDPE